MKIIDEVEYVYWIKDGVNLPSNFDLMNGYEKWNYLWDNKLLHREEGPAVICSLFVIHSYLTKKVIRSLLIDLSICN